MNELKKVFSRLDCILFGRLLGHYDVWNTKNLQWQCKKCGRRKYK